MKKILIVDDDQDIRLLLSNFFKKKGYEVKVASNGNEAIKSLKKDKADLVILDFKLPDYTGIEILQKIKVIDSQIQVIIITGYSDVNIAVESVKKGAFDYVTKPLYPDEIQLTVEKALKHSKEKQDNKSAPTTKRSNSNVVRKFVPGISPQSKSLQKQIELVAPTDLSVIILGETGTGKEYVAREIHHKSERKNYPFIAVDCGALPKDLAASELFGHVKGAFTGAVKEKKGCFELASTGTLFLDEIGNLTYENQVKLLRVLQERVVKRVGGTRDIPVDVRVLTAANESFPKAVKSGEFREDIYHRLNEFRIELSPLRERPDDIEHFAHHFLEDANQQLNKQVDSFEANVMDKLRKYYWHGNLRELNNVVKRCVLLSNSRSISISSLPPEISDPILSKTANSMLVDSTENQKIKSLKSIAEDAEKKGIIEALKQSNFNKTRTAKLLEVDRKTLYNKMKSYGIDV